MHLRSMGDIVTDTAKGKTLKEIDFRRDKESSIFDQGGILF